jgi:hypothetical protein
MTMDLGAYPLCQHFLAGYLSVRQDPTNFPVDEFPDLFDRYEKVFKSALDALGLSKEELRNREEFDFDSGDASTLESAIGVLRAVESLCLLNFHSIMLLKPPGADMLCEKKGEKVCCEVKTITKQSAPRRGFFIADQVYEKILENIAKARVQLQRSTKRYQCTVTIFISVSNWFDQAIYLKKQDYQYIVDRLEKDQLEGESNFMESLKGVDGVLFVTKFGTPYLFLNERGKSID